MPSLSPSAARTQLAELLNETVFQALGLKESLEEERKGLQAQDLESIDAAVENKSTCVLKLRDLDNKRMGLCVTCGFADGPLQMQQLIDWCDDSEVIKSRWDQLLVIVAESSALNMTNGAIIRVRQQQFESSLSVLRGKTPGADTYGRYGGESGGFGHRSLAQA